MQLCNISTLARESDLRKCTFDLRDREKHLQRFCTMMPKYLFNPSLVKQETLLVYFIMLLIAL